MTHRVMNFGPGPAALPLAALERAQSELLSFEGTGISILEHSHRGKPYARVHEEAKSLLRELFAIPSSHEILFMQGGASAQFALVPMNLLGDGQSADYIVTGTWSEKALAEARLIGKTRVAASTELDGRYTRVPRDEEIERDRAAAYVHLTSNNTIFGTQFHELPAAEDAPLVVDMSSDFGWKPIDISKFGLVYAGAQKNLGPAGVTVVIGRRDLLERSPAHIPKIFRYATALAGDSLYNTAPTFAIYMVRNVLAWMKNEGGLPAMERRNREKAAMLYGAIDAESEFYRCPVERESRSMMNVVFRLPSEELEVRFIKEAEAAEMVGIKGHRSTGGIRVSIYNAAEIAHVRALTDFMHEFVRRHG